MADNTDRPITREHLKQWKARSIMHLDGDDFYSNHYQCNEEPRLTYVDSGPRKPYGRKATSKRKHERKWFVDNIECQDVDAVLTMLNSTSVKNQRPDIVDD